MRPTVLLYDVDGTLITTRGAGRRAIERTFERRFGRAGTLDFSFGGMTDRAIVRQGLAALGWVAPSGTDAAQEIEREIDAVLALYLEILPEEMTNTADIRVHDGIWRSLEVARGRADFAVGLGTGNVRAGARIKLQRVGLHDQFAFGGFGCDHVERPRLLQIGAERGAALLGVAVEACRVVVIGDTPKDVAAACAIGAESVAVATGAATLDELIACAPTYVFPNLAAPGAGAALFGNER